MPSPFIQIKFRREAGAGLSQIGRGSSHSIVTQYVSLLANKRDTALAARTAEIAKTIVAVDTGATRDSIQAEGKQVSAEFGAPYLEYGTIDMDAQPFLRPASKLAIKEWNNRHRPRN